MSRQTSIQAYYAAVNSGLLSRTRKEILRIVAHYGPMTANEAFDELARQHHETPVHSRAGQFTRLTELKDMDLVDEIGTRPCKITGRNVILWDISGRAAKRLEPREKKEDRIAQLEEDLALCRQENARLRGELKKMNGQMYLLPMNT